MSWYNEAIFYHIYPLGLTGAPKENDYGTPVHRLNTLLPWIDHIKEIGCTALYIGPLFESVGHGYETTDYKKLDSRLGTNKDLTNFVKACHEKGIRVIFDGVFNHTGRDFFAFKDIQKNREHSPYVNWYCNVNFGGNTEYNDGFSYENWGGYNLLVKLNQRNPEVQNYICDVIRFWVSEFDIDGIRLDAADVLDFDFMRILRHTADEVKKDFWLMGEVIHGDYSRWVNGQTLHSVTNYALHKALYSGHNDHNYFEIAHTVKYLQNMGDLDLYNFVDTIGYSSFKLDYVVKWLNDYFEFYGEAKVSCDDNGWIPVQGRLPEDNHKGIYDMQLVTLEDGEVCMGVYNNREKEWWTRKQEGERWYTNKHNVIAWQPLPEPYKEEKKC